MPQHPVLLAADDSDYPVNHLTKAGVDLSDPDFWNQGIKSMRKLVDWEESLAKELYPATFA